MAKISHIAGRAAGSIAQAVTNYFPLYGGSPLLLGTEALGSRTIRTAGVYSNMYLRISANTLSGSCVVKFRKNGADGSQAFTITAGATGQFEDTTNTDTVAATDTACVQAAAAAGGTSISLVQFGFAFAATTNTVFTHGGGQSALYTANATKNYIKWNGALLASSETAVMQLRARIAGTVKNYAVLTTTNARTTTTTVGNRLNGADGALTTSISSTTTGWTEDTTHTATIASGDLLNRYVLGGASAENFLAQQMSEFESAASEVQYMASGAAIAISGSSTVYDHINGASVMTATQSSTQRPLQFAGRVTNGQIYISANAAVTDSLLTLQKNGSDTAFIVTVTALTTGIFEFSATPVNFAATDQINWKWVTGSGGSVTSDWSSLVVGPIPDSSFKRKLAIQGKQSNAPAYTQDESNSTVVTMRRNSGSSGSGSGNTNPDDLWFFRNRRRMR